ncbi:helix-turn-helix transcriptional regulator [Novosphingobium rosa]|uniref:helix-turn-helix transcriptional regulator n=1 Tax=Novosphingobium rosa TaxID=76978 RepID=UPI00082DAD97|nr:LuxR C-terminal-related transcriptional regulator [Novosphingobium rosa]
MDDIIQDLVTGAYAAALDDTLWEDWVWRTAQLLGGACGALHVVDASGRVQHQTQLHDNVQAVARYRDEEIWRFDPQVSFVTGLRGSKVYTDTDHVDLENSATKEYFAWQASNALIRHYVTAAARLNGGSHVVALSVHRDVKDGVTPDLSRRIMERLLPDMHRALELGFLHNQKLTAAYWDGLLTKRQEPCLLLGEGGHVLRMTPAMEDLLRSGDGLACVRGRLTCGGGIADAPLDAFVGSLASAFSFTRSCSIPRPSGKAPYVMTGYPLPRRMLVLAPEAVAMVRVIVPGDFPETAHHQWQAAFGFTRKETEFARYLVGGHSVETASACMDISTTTARVHVRNLLMKTQTNRQMDMIRLLVRFTA